MTFQLEKLKTTIPNAHPVTLFSKMIFTIESFPTTKLLSIKDGANIVQYDDTEAPSVSNI